MGSSIVGVAASPARDRTRCSVRKYPCVAMERILSWCVLVFERDFFFMTGGLYFAGQ